MILRVVLMGDVMTGRGLEQARATAAPPELHEPSIRDARDYLALVERTSGPVPRPVAPDYPWDAAQSALEDAGCDLRLINLADLEAKGALDRLNVHIFQLRRLRLEAGTEADARWLAGRLSRTGPLDFRSLGPGRLAAQPEADPARRPTDRSR